ncbi:hypothetical protein [Oryzobacter telluris]|uniref:hypothetical protein n=1 Tax=Oryzobacter telluris TaxID=3149179 RepID=UPI00370D054F
MSALPRPTRLATAAVVATALAALTGCGSDAPERPQDVVVTVTASPSPSASSAAPSASAKPATIRSDVKGRRFDFGLVESRRTSGGTDVLVIDRWTDPKVDDALLAKQGLPVEPYEVRSARYLNQKKKTFDVPVREGTSFLLNHCVALGEPPETRSVSAEELAAASSVDRLLLVELDAAGYATGGETFPGC